MRILVSGAAGFIASHLTDLLLAEGHDVIGADNFITGRRENIAHLKSNPRYSFVEHDVCMPFPTSAISGAIERIYHLASPASPRAYASHRIDTMKVNSLGTWNLLDLAVAKGAKFLITSTSEIYGDPAHQTQREDYWGNVNPIGIRSMYEEAKRFGEACTMAYHRERQADTRIVRLFNTYGPRMDVGDGRVVTTFITAALKGEAITVYGDGTQTRSLSYVADQVRGIALAMEADFHEPINLGNPEQTTILQLAREVITLVPGCRSKISFGPSPAYDPRDRRPDISRARQILSWTPKVDRKEGLAKVLEYFRQTLQT